MEQIIQEQELDLNGNQDLQSYQILGAFNGSKFNDYIQGDEFKNGMGML